MDSHLLNFSLIREIQVCVLAEAYSWLVARMSYLANWNRLRRDYSLKFNFANSPKNFFAALSYAFAASISSLRNKGVRHLKKRLCHWLFTIYYWLFFSSWWVREIRFCEFAEVFLCGLIISLCGFCLVFECAEKYSSAVNTYLCGPLLPPLTKCNTLVFRVTYLLRLSRVPTILQASCRSQICLPIIETVAVDVVALQAGGSFCHYAVHADRFSPFTVSGWPCSDGVKLAEISADIPFVFA